MSEWRIIAGDVIDGLRTLADGSVNCCATSPPYWGLRDYGTATWEGGDAGCDHRDERQAARNLKHSASEQRQGRTADEGKLRDGIASTRRVCQCGAVRIDQQIGLEPTPDAYIARMVEVFREVRRVLRDDATCWINLGDAYIGGGRGGGGSFADERPGWAGMEQGTSEKRSVAAAHGLKPKDLCGMPWRVAFALRADGWYLRSDIIWHKPNPMPESVTDRPTKAHEYVFLLSKSERYFYDAAAVAEPLAWPADRRAPVGTLDGLQRPASGGRERGPRMPPIGGIKHTENGHNGTLVGNTPEWPQARNARSVWTIATQPYPEAHFATFPEKLVEKMILAGCPPAGKRCDCDEVIGTPVGEVSGNDPSRFTGRAGMNRVRGEHEGRRLITRREQRGHAAQLRDSPHRDEIELLCGQAFSHYIRTDRSGARPLPPEMLADLSARGWLVAVPPCTCPIEPAGAVLDPFAGSGTTLAVAVRHGRNAIGCELNPEYIKLAERRIGKEAPLFVTKEKVPA